MKKFLALALTALMLVCAIIPAFAAVEANDAVPADLANAERVNFREQVDPLFEGGTLAWGGATGFPWNKGDFTAGGQFEPLEAHAFWFTNTEFVLEADFEPSEDGEYAFAMYIANKTTQGNGKDLLDSTTAGKFAVQIMKNGSEVAYYEIVEEEAEVGSRIYYRLGDGVALEADTVYTVCVQMTQKTDSCVVDFLYGIPGAEAPADDPAEDTSAESEDTTAAPSTPSAPAAAAAELPEIFADADFINLGAIYEEVNTANDGAFAAGQVLYHWHAGDFAKWGVENMQGILPFANCNYPVDFEVGDDGKYTAAISMTCHTGVAAGAIVKICDEDGNVLCEETITHTSTTPGEILYYTLGTELDLAADSYYTAYFSSSTEKANAIVCEFYYALTELNEDAGSSAEDTTASQGGEQTSPATFDAAIIALAVAGASAAVAVVSKKRR
ncbi:MAG: hypothetical protein IJZ08_08870 [Clostridia bacterium]|nr:hypothetical protein [Clostridia bacterium]